MVSNQIHSFEVTISKAFDPALAVRFYAKSSQSSKTMMNLRLSCDTLDDTQIQHLTEVESKIP